MRKLLTLATLCLYIGISKLNAQTDRATLLLGGSASFQAANGSSLFLFNPNFGVFVIKDLAVGLQANIISSGGNSQWSLGPFGRYYFGGNDKGKLFGQGSLLIGRSTGPDVYFGAGLTGGYAFFLNQNIAIELAASYFRIEDGGLFVIGAGFQIHFKKHK